MRRAYRLSSRFHRIALRNPLHADQLHGERNHVWPMMALRTQPELGDCRHVLSQMVVAGTMSVFPPIHISVSPNEPTDQMRDDPSPREGE